ncbi:hypothetical protein HDU89_005698 [Geranomyces variabilis]|nr:hypothetical protein HDU89_005698 [Geranomyces variabilis]
MAYLDLSESMPLRWRSQIPDWSDDANDQDAVDITDEADDVEELREIIRGFQNGKVSGSLPFYNFLLAGAPAEVEAYAPIFKNRVHLNGPCCPYGSYLVDIQVHLGRLPSRSQRELLTMSNEIYPRRGADGLVAAAVQEGYQPAAASSDDEDLRVFLQILNNLEPLPVGELLPQGSERTLDFGSGGRFINFSFAKPGSASTSARSKATQPSLQDAKTIRKPQVAQRTGSSRQRTADAALVEKRSGLATRSATPILWLIQNHKWCVVYVVWARSRDVVVAEYVGHCRNPISSQNLPLGVAKGVELFLKARQVIRHALHQITSVALRAPPASLAEITNNGIVIPSTPNTIKFGLRSPPRKVARIAEDAMASRALLLRRDRQHNGGALLSTTSWREESPEEEYHDYYDYGSPEPESDSSEPAALNAVAPQNIRRGRLSSCILM